jgi:hypothetical protein
MNPLIFKNVLFGFLRMIFLNIVVGFTLFSLGMGLLYFLVSVDPKQGNSDGILMLLVHLIFFCTVLPAVCIGFTQLTYGIPMILNWRFAKNQPGRVYGAIAGMLLTAVISLKIAEISKITEIIQNISSEWM